MSGPEIERRFSGYGAVGEYCKALAYELDELLPEGVDKALSIRALETVMLRGHAALVRGQGDGTQA